MRFKTKLCTTVQVKTRQRIITRRPTENATGSTSRYMRLLFTVYNAFNTRSQIISGANDKKGGHKNQQITKA